MEQPADHTILNKIYEGSRSVVYKGRRNADHLPVIIKSYSNPLPDSKDVERLQKEFEIGQKFERESKNIIQYYGLEKFGRGLALIEEDYNAESLNNFINPDGFSIEDFLQLALQICAGLEIIHKNNIIHKDIKPANLVYSPENNLLKFIDFGISTSLHQEFQKAGAPEKLQGTMQYLSPEQTGRMNRALDYRTDFYSLGVTFYEILCGRLPFESKNSMELIHHHIARIPAPPGNFKENLPGPIAEIILKLLSKNPEERYQSTSGLYFDLEICFNEYKTSGHISPFKLGQKDHYGKFIIPQKLYGRNNEVNITLNAFERVKRGAKEALFVAGYSGVGKSALIGEIQKPIALSNGYYVAGKFDQYSRSTAYNGIARAFKELIHYLLGEEDKKIEDLKNKLLKELAEDIRFVCDIIPEITFITGEVNDSVPVDPEEARGRFNLTFGKFIQIFATKENPLVFFLDDLQWADVSSLHLLKYLLSDESKIKHLLFVGAYRDNEIDFTHQLPALIADLKREKVYVNKISLSPLTLEAINDLISETLHSDPRETEPLTKAVYSKFGGNPFYFRTFLYSLYEEGLLTFLPGDINDSSPGKWKWDIKGITEKKATENVADILRGKISRLPSQTRRLLSLGASLQNEFDIRILSIIANISVEEVHKGLYPALTGEILLLSDKTYKFAHDKLQETSYNLVGEAERKKTHLNNARLLLPYYEKGDEGIPLHILLGQYNRGRELISDNDEKIRLAGFNFQAGKTSRETTAYEFAKELFLISLELLSENSPSENSRLKIDIYLELAECYILIGIHDDLEEIFNTLEKLAQELKDQIKIWILKSTLYAILGDFSAGFKGDLSALRRLGFNIPEEEGRLKKIAAEGLDNLNKKFSSLSFSDLAGLPLMKGEIALLTMDVLAGATLRVYNLGKRDLYVLYLTAMVDLTLKYGRSDKSPFGLARYADVQITVFENYEQSYKIMNFALELANLSENKTILVQIQNFAELANNHWRLPFQRLINNLKLSFQLGQESGNPQLSAYILWHIVSLEIIANNPVKEILDETEEYIAVSNNLGASFITHFLKFQKAFLELLYLNKTEEVELYFRKHVHPDTFQKNFIYRSICNFFLLKLSVIFGHFDLAFTLAGETYPAFSLAHPTFFYTPDLMFYYALAILTKYESLNETDKKKQYKEIKNIINKFEVWGEKQPQNYSYKLLLIQAELERIKGNLLAAMNYYDLAIEKAEENNLQFDEALAGEFAARFYFSISKKKIANAYLRDAAYLYERWGANCKVKALEEKHPWLSIEQPLSTLHGAETDSIEASYTETGLAQKSNTLDLDTVFNASQAISQEIDLEILITKLIKVIIENAGAQSGFIILKSGDALFLEASIIGEKIEVLQSKPLAECQDISHSIIRYVHRTEEVVVLHDAYAGKESKGIFSEDPHIKNNKSRSILCMPIRNQDRINGLLYLENKLSTNVFTKNRLKTLDILMSQASISIENARLYEASQKTQAELLNYNKELESFAYSLAHDLRTPLRGIGGLSQILSRDYEENIDEQGRDYLDRIRQGVLRMGKQMDALLVVSQIFRKKLEISELNLSQIAEKVARKIRNENPERTLEFQIEPNLVAKGDAEFLEIVLENLFENSEKFTRGIAAPVISFGKKMDGERVIYFVKDNGVGFDKTYSDKLFRPFEKLHNQDELEGLGIGLAMLERIIRRHRGGVWAESEPGEGANFYFTLK